MAKKSKKTPSFIDDGDDAHFPDNPAVAKPRRKKAVAALSMPKMKGKAKKSSKKKNVLKK